MKHIDKVHRISHTTHSVEAAKVVTIPVLNARNNVQMTTLEQPVHSKCGNITPTIEFIRVTLALKCCVIVICVPNLSHVAILKDGLKIC